MPAHSLPSDLRLMLHLLLNPQAWNRCSRSTSPGDALVFLGDGVYAMALQETADCFALENDCVRRGVEIPNGVQRATMSELVSLVAKHSHSITWTQ